MPEKQHGIRRGARCAPEKQYRRTPFAQRLKMTKSTENNRKSIRLKGYDYSKKGAYFITICANGGSLLFGNIFDGKIQLNATGQIVEEEWSRSPTIRDEIELDTFVVMPNHIHGIVYITGERKGEHPDNILGEHRSPLRGGVPVGARGACPNNHTDNVVPHGACPNNITGERRSPLRMVSHSIGSFISGFKSSVTKQVRHITRNEKFNVWQRNYYEHIIRDEKSLERIREYIINNPLRWYIDRENPDGRGEDEFDNWLANI